MSNSRTADAERSRKLILAAAERLMVREGYAAVSSRRVAAEAGVKPPLVHYYYKTTDDLLIALYRRTASETLKRITKAVEADKPLKALWELNVDAPRTVLAVEFLALANHRPAVRAEISLQAERFRSMQAGALARIFRGVTVSPDVNVPRGVTLLLAGVARALVMEDALGISAGHDDARALVEWLIRRFEGHDHQTEPPSAEAV